MGVATQLHIAQAKWLYKYLKPINSLPIPNPLSQRIHPSAITKSTKKKRREYNKNTDKAVVACENGIVATIRHFAGKKMESIVRDWKSYNNLLWQ